MLSRQLHTFLQCNQFAKSPVVKDDKHSVTFKKILLYAKYSLLSAHQFVPKLLFAARHKLPGVRKINPTYASKSSTGYSITKAPPRYDKHIFISTDSAETSNLRQKNAKSSLTVRPVYPAMSLPTKKQQ